MFGRPAQILTAAILAIVLTPAANAQKNITAKINVGGKDFYGRPVGFDGKKVALLDHVGRLQIVPTNSSDDLKVIANEFHSYRTSDIAKILENEFGERYDISTTNQYVVVHPWGSAGVYAKPFETFFERFEYFFESNGVALERPEHPMVALVLRSRNDFERNLINEVDVRDARIGGYYSKITNRITTYDPTGQLRESGDRWIYSANPIIHEATHQSAFNTGIHNRFAPPPKWLSEGLATLFEARGINHAFRYKKPSDRVNALRLNSLRSFLQKEGVKASLINLVANDRIFSSDVEMAYAYAWGLTFYLVETAPEKYFEYLKWDSRRENFTAYPSDQRLRKFMQTFNTDFEELEKNLKSYYFPKRSRSPQSDQ